MRETWWHGSLCDVPVCMIKEGIVEVYMINSWDNWGAAWPGQSTPKSEKDAQEEPLPDTPIVIDVPSNSVV